MVWGSRRCRGRPRSRGVVGVVAVPAPAGHDVSAAGEGAGMHRPRSVRGRGQEHPWAVGDGGGDIFGIVAGEAGAQQVKGVAAVHAGGQRGAGPLEHHCPRRGARSGSRPAGESAQRSHGWPRPARATGGSPLA